MKNQQMKNSKAIEKLEPATSITGVNTYNTANKSFAMAGCTSPTTNPSMCMCTMGSVRSGLPAMSKGNTFVCDNLDMQ